MARPLAAIAFLLLWLWGCAFLDSYLPPVFDLIHGSPWWSFPVQATEWIVGASVFLAILFAPSRRVR